MRGEGKEGWEGARGKSLLDGTHYDFIIISMNPGVHNFTTKKQHRLKTIY